MLRSLIALVLAGVVLAPVGGAGAAEPTPLTNLAHLDFLGDRVTPPQQTGHTTYRLAQDPSVGTLWTYADRQDDGSFKRVGGGTYDATHDTYGQGAFNADDMARAAVVYLRHWKLTGAASSRHAAYEMLRGLTYLQTTTGAHRGNVVLWMQPDGTLHPSADPVEQPDPSDSDASYWLARTVWALGEGYAAFERTDPAFARFLRTRLDLATGAIDRQVLDAYGQHLNIDGRRMPAWLIANGADASAEAVLGLAAYVRAGGGGKERTVLTQLTRGITEMSAGNARTWPFGAVQPWNQSLSHWHAWASQMPAALAASAAATGDRAARAAAARDSFTFDPWLLTSGGPDNGRFPTRADGTQIAYGVDSRVQSLIATGGGADRMAGITAAWFFGANASGQPAYDPATGVTIDGIAADGTVNHNSGAESTIHGLLTMLALDAHPAVRRIAQTSDLQEQVGTSYVQAEDAQLSGGATAVKPESAWTGEAQYGGTGYASMPAGSTATFDLGPHPASLVIPVVELQPSSRAVTSFVAGRGLGSVRSGAIGPQGDSPAPGALLPVTLPTPTSAPTLTASTRGGTARLDAVMVQPLVSRLVLGGHGHGTALLRSAATSTSRTTVEVPGSGRAEVWSYDGTGRLLGHTTSAASDVPVTVAPGGVTIVRR
ncbi:hypothetical protein [Marmoricola sp. URHB0036]|uniref:hypothetical protein n=1 Tax=Marmoricola sp. URHB0036 TaxID=1298863 RepID=UPI0009DBFD6F|nr:hypothetical protein [Marmoricola sp. URHB0036]